MKTMIIKISIILIKLSKRELQLTRHIFTISNKRIHKQIKQSQIKYKWSNPITNQIYH
jgi:hypothetical protein